MLPKVAADGALHISDHCLQAFLTDFWEVPQLVNHAPALAAHAAKGGSVTRLDAEASSGVTDRQWYAAARGQIDLRSKLDGSEAEREAERKAEANFRRAYLRSMGEGEDDGARSELVWQARMGGDMEIF